MKHDGLIRELKKKIVADMYQPEQPKTVYECRRAGAIKAINDLQEKGYINFEKLGKDFRQ